MKPSLLNPNFEYISAEDSRKPGYLRAKFAKIRRRLQAEAEAAKAQATVVPIKAAK